MGTWQTYLADNQAQFLEQLIEFLRIPSISALPEHAGDVQQAAEWVAARLKKSGVENVEVMPTGGHPVVYADWLHAPDQPTILIYGHFDTQPADPYEAWTNPPFEPVVRDGRIYARGASDNKGNMLAPILAVEALLRTEERLPVKIQFFFEGQEEIASPQLAGFIARHRNLFACDMVFSADSTQWSEDQPSLLLSWKGICGVQIDVSAASSDLHSGIYGGAVQNPANALAHILDSMRSPEGKILVEGFYDDVIPLSEAEKAQLSALPFDEAAYKKEIGLEDLDLVSEPGYTAPEHTAARPTLDVNGIWSGFQGEGTKTIIPNQAHAKITCRLVADQDPQKIIALLRDHVARHAPPGVRVTVQTTAEGVRPYRVSVDHPGNEVARQVLEELYGKNPYYIRLGGTLPASTLFLEQLGAYTISLAFSLDDERIHAPDEFFRLSSFERSQKAYCMALHKLSQMKV
ncbi:MAG: dipeptidase [Anaerolineaceae bacterium]|nr:dipeptidase [Anaerolineaceae bacterium]